jgi:hypothetical protein
MQRLMKRPVSVRIPNAREDAVQPAIVLALAGVGMGLGVLLSSLVYRDVPATPAPRSTQRAADDATLRVEPPHASRPVDDTQRAPSPAATDAAAAAAAPVAARDESTRPTPALAETPPPQSAPVDAQHKPARFERGIVAYVRCDGLERKGARFPCPRDRELETRIFTTLAKLPACRQATLGLGQGEVRLEWKDGNAPTIDVRGGNDGASLNERAVSQCVAKALGTTRPKLHSAHWIVAFRFALR